MKPAVASSFDVAEWFIRQSKRDRVNLSPLKLHRLMYLAQVGYARRTAGDALMPSMFVATELGPLEPNLYRAFEHGTPKVAVRDPTEQVRNFLQLVWHKYGEEPIDALNRLMATDAAFKQAEAAGIGSEITLAMMKGGAEVEEAPAAVRFVRGKRVQRWMPPTAPTPGETS
jgi:uncharacterized phage-associated protein